MAQALLWLFVMALGAILAALYLVKLWRRVAPRFASDARLARVSYRAVLDRLAEAGISREYGETRERFARRAASVAPSFQEATALVLAQSLGNSHGGDRAKWQALRRAIREELSQHVLLEDFPGSGKTTLAKALGDCIVDDRPDDDIVSIRRIQFTPDLLPSDVTGTTIFDPNTNKFLFRPGPVFAHVVLADEINRTSPKVQSALLEAMGEKQVTVDNRTRKLDPLFFVIATQNPLDFSGTFPLPAAQLDRFLFKIRMKHIPREAELEVLASIRTRRVEAKADDLPRMTRTEILDARAVVEEQIYVAPMIRECLVDIAERTRQDPRILSGLNELSCAQVPRALPEDAPEEEKALTPAQRLAREAHRQLFGARVRLSGVDLGSLDGRAQGGSRLANERLRELIRRDAVPR